MDCTSIVIIQKHIFERGYLKIQSDNLLSFRRIFFMAYCIFAQHNLAKTSMTGFLQSEYSECTKFQ